jgi:hypothetical protein
MDNVLHSEFILIAFRLCRKENYIFYTNKKKEMYSAFM